MLSVSAESFTKWILCVWVRVIKAGKGKLNKQKKKSKDNHNLLTSEKCLAYLVVFVLKVIMVYPMIGVRAKWDAGWTSFLHIPARAGTGTGAGLVGVIGVLFD